MANENAWRDLMEVFKRIGSLPQNRIYASYCPTGFGPSRWYVSTEEQDTEGRIADFQRTAAHAAALASRPRTRPDGWLDWLELLRTNSIRTRSGGSLWVSTSDDPASPAVEPQQITDIVDVCAASAEACVYLGAGTLRVEPVMRRGASDPPPQAGNAERISTTWGEVKIEFISDERIQIAAPSRNGTFNYAEMGLENRRNGKPVLAWSTLRDIAKHRGSVAVPLRARTKLEKRMQELRKVLRHRIKSMGFEVPCDADPLPYKRDTRTYEAAFRAGTRPSFDS